MGQICVWNLISGFNLVFLEEFGLLVSLVEVLDKSYVKFVKNISFVSVFLKFCLKIIKLIFLAGSLQCLPYLLSGTSKKIGKLPVPGSFVSLCPSLV